MYGTKGSLLSGALFNPKFYDDRLSGYRLKHDVSAGCEHRMTETHACRVMLC